MTSHTYIDAGVVKFTLLPTEHLWTVTLIGAKQVDTSAVIHARV